MSVYEQRQQLSVRPLAVAVLLLNLALACSLSCAPCDETTCAKTSCPGRRVLDACGCCLVCARGVGEPCGGYFDSLGLCDDDLLCLTSPEHGEPVDTGAEGICAAKSTQSSAAARAPCVRHVCQLILGRCTCTELEECRPPVPDADPTRFHTHQQCEQAAQKAAQQRAQPPTTAPARVDCPASACDVGETSCPDDSVLKRSPARRPDCCPPVGVCLCDLEACAPRPPACADALQPVLVARAERTPGACCDRWQCKSTASAADTAAAQNCTWRGGSYASGETWLSDDCHTCTCRRTGLTFCRAVQCDSVANCTGKVTQKAGDCCPTCVDGCVSPSGVHHANSEQWLEDDCTTCSCVDGVRSCHSEMCHITCRHPRLVPGRCCPVCDECDVICQHGYRTDRDGGQLCQCLTAEEAAAPAVTCASMAACKLSCPHGFQTDAAGCERCKCHKCRKLRECAKTCRHGFATDERGCALCKCRNKPDKDGHGSEVENNHRQMKECTTKEGTSYAEGWQWSDGCRQCACHGGQQLCTMIACPVPRCSHPQMDAGHCCPTCPGTASTPSQVNITVCQSVDGRTYLDGQLWQLDSCTRCMCRAGQVLCGSASCPPAPCLHPRRRTPADCCATCHSDSSTAGHQGAACRDNRGRPHADGDAWRKDACTSCLCTDGAVKCFHEKCDPLDCARPVMKKGHCCPVCLDSSPCRLENGTSVSDGAAWSVDACTSCVCQRGRPLCARRPCPPQCSAGDPRHPCCLHCSDAERSKWNNPYLKSVSKATHRTVFRPPPESQTFDPQAAPGRSHTQSGGGGETDASSKFTILWVVIACLSLALISVLAALFWRRHRRGYSPKPLPDEKRPLNDAQIMHFVRLDNRGVPHDTLVLEKHSDPARDT